MTDARPAAAFGFLDTPLPLAMAHRGGARQGVENTMAAFEAAVGMGYRYVETDVHTTADGVVVAFHDRMLHRVTGVTGAIADLTWRELSALPLTDGQRVPLLADLLGAWPDLRVNIDVKVDQAVRPLIEVIKGTGALDRVCVGAFADRRVAAVRHALGPQLCTALGPREALRLRLASYRAGAGGGTPGVPCAQLPHRLGPLQITDRRLIERAHELGMQVHVWTIDEPAEMTWLLDAGVDGIMTDSPDVLREVLVGRGRWHG